MRPCQNTRNADSRQGREPYVGGGIYCATKAAVRSFTESLRKELIATRIRVIGVDPGQVETVSVPPNTTIELAADLDRTSQSFAFTETSPRPMLSTRKLCGADSHVPLLMTTQRLRAIDPR